MSKNELVRIFNNLDTDKFDLLEKGIAFELIIKDKSNSSYLHTGIGLGDDMSELCLYSLLGIYRSACTVSIEDYAESVKEALIEAEKVDLFNMREI